jgi:hypothetical protein
VAENLLPEHHSDIFVDLIKDIVQQLKENPDRLPVLPHCPLDSPVTTRKPRDRERDTLTESHNRVSFSLISQHEEFKITKDSVF